MSEHNPEPAQDKKHPYQTIGGWLWLFMVSSFLSAFFVFMFIFGKTGIVGVLRVWGSHPGAHGFLLLARQALGIFNITISVFFAVKLLMRDPLFLRVRQWGIAGAAVSTVLFVIEILVYGLPSYGIYFNKWIYLCYIVFAFIAGNGLAMLYYTRSVRVRTYMGSGEYLRRAFFTKKIKGPEPAVPDAPTDWAI